MALSREGWACAAGRATASLVKKLMAGCAMRWREGSQAQQSKQSSQGCRQPSCEGRRSTGARGEGRMTPLVWWGACKICDASDFSVVLRLGRPAGRRVWARLGRGLLAVYRPVCCCGLGWPMASVSPRQCSDMTTSGQIGCQCSPLWQCNAAVCSVSACTPLFTAGPPPGWRTAWAQW